MRVASLIRLKPDCKEQYIILHKHTFPGVLDRIRQSNIRNYSIFLREGMLFSYWEYVGEDYDRDMAEIRRDEITKDWWKLTEPMQEPLKTRREGKWWASMEELFHWGEQCESNEKTRRMALTARIIRRFDRKMIQSFKTACSVLFVTPEVTNIRNFSVYHKDMSLYSYFEYPEENSGTDFVKLHTGLKVEDELCWAPMKEVFHTD